MYRFFLGLGFPLGTYGGSWVSRTAVAVRDGLMRSEDGWAGALEVRTNGHESPSTGVRKPLTRSLYGMGRSMDEPVSQR